MPGESLQSKASSDTASSGVPIPRVVQTEVDRLNQEFEISNSTFFSQPLIG
jgi:hypothetical protein